MTGPMTDTGSGRLHGIGRIATITLVIVAIVGIAWLLVELIGFLLQVFAALVLAVIFDAVTDRVCRIPYMRRGPALALSVLALVGLFAGVFFLFGTQLTREFDTIRDSIPPAVAQVQSLLDRFGLGKPARDL